MGLLMTSRNVTTDIIHHSHFVAQLEILVFAANASSIKAWLQVAMTRSLNLGDGTVIKL